MPLKLLVLSYRTVQILTWGPESGKSVLFSHCCWVRILLHLATCRETWEYLPDKVLQQFMLLRVWKCVLAVQALSPDDSQRTHSSGLCLITLQKLLWFLLSQQLLEIPYWKRAYVVSTSLCLRIWNRKWLWFNSRQPNQVKTYFINNLTILEVDFVWASMHRNNFIFLWMCMCHCMLKQILLEVPRCVPH